MRPDHPPSNINRYNSYREIEQAHLKHQITNRQHTILHKQCRKCAFDNCSNLLVPNQDKDYCSEWCRKKEEASEAGGYYSQLIYD